MARSRRARTALLLAMGSALSACGDGDGAQPPPSITQNEQQAVAQAAEMLDERVTVEGEAETATPE